MWLCLAAQSYPTLCNSIDYTVHEIFQARLLEWVAFPFSKDLPNPGIEPRSPILQADSLPAEPQGKPSFLGKGSPFLLGGPSRHRVTGEGWYRQTKPLNLSSLLMWLFSGFLLHSVAKFLKWIPGLSWELFLLIDICRGMETEVSCATIFVYV